MLLFYPAAQVRWLFITLFTCGSFSSWLLRVLSMVCDQDLLQRLHYCLFLPSTFFSFNLSRESDEFCGIPAVQPTQTFTRVLLIYSVFCESSLAIVSHVTTASPSPYPSSTTYAFNGVSPSSSWLAWSRNSFRTTTASLSPSPSNTTYAPNGDVSSTSWPALSRNSSPATTASTSPRSMNMTYALSGTNSTNSTQTLSTDPSLDEWDFCGSANPTSCSCQALYNSHASTSFYTSTWTDRGGKTTFTFDDGQISIIKVPATTETYTGSEQIFTDLAYVPPTDCCQPCYLLAYFVRLLYWPVEDKRSGINKSSITDTASLIYTTVSNDFTLYASTPPHVVQV